MRNLKMEAVRSLETPETFSATTKSKILQVYDASFMP
jgi:hypothetical protein